MPKFLENKLKKEYGNNPKAIYGTMNKMGYMKGSKTTAKGKMAEKKHKMKSKSAKTKLSKAAGKMFMS